MPDPFAAHEAASPPRYAVVFTTYDWDAFNAAQFRRHAARVASGDMHVVVDESRGAVDVPADLSKVSASQPAAARLGLRVAYLRTLFWHNIDYLYYLFYDRWPDYDYYIFLDYDAVVERDYDDLVAEIHRHRLDFVGHPVGGPLEQWTFYDAQSSIYDPASLRACISAVTVLSNRALAHLFRRRRADSRRPTPQQRTFWPICEAFVPTELAIAGFALADLAAFGDVETFSWWPPTLDERLAPADEPAFIHPVLDRPRFIASMLKHARTADFLWPRSRLWRAVFACPDHRWIVPLLWEAMRRLRRVLRPVAGPAEVVKGMKPLKRDADTARSRAHSTSIDAIAVSRAGAGR